MVLLVVGAAVLLFFPSSGLGSVGVEWGQIFFEGLASLSEAPRHNVRAHLPRKPFQGKALTPETLSGTWASGPEHERMQAAPLQHKTTTKIKSTLFIPGGGALAARVEGMPKRHQLFSQGSASQLLYKRG